MPSLCGKRHLPLPRGRYVVGTTDLMTSTNLFMRCFYPTTTTTTTKASTEQQHDKWPKWLPSLEYADGYMRFKFSRGLPLVPNLFRWLVHDPCCPTVHNADILESDKPLPIVVFSHGMGAMRTTYSTLLSDLASQGYFVAALEHRDGSASSTINTDGSWTFERKILPDEVEYEVRNAQVGERIRDCESAVQLLQKLSKGESHEWTLFKPTDEFLASLQNRLDFARCYISGHSFGSATALKALYTSKYVSIYTFDFTLLVLYLLKPGVA